jgi:hypothetical protein
MADVVAQYLSPYIRKPTVEGDMQQQAGREHTIHIPQKGITKRRYVVIESPPCEQKYTNQLVMATPKEMEEMKKEFPGLVVRWAENEDLAKWKLANELFG